jgi:hypothetical protein
LVDTAPRRAIGARTSHPLPFLFSPNSLLCLLRSVRALSLSLPVLPPLFFPSPLTLRQVAPAALPLSLLFSFQKRKATTPQRASRNAHLATRISQRASRNAHLATRILQRASRNAHFTGNEHFATRISRRASLHATLNVRFAKRSWGASAASDDQGERGCALRALT